MIDSDNLVRSDTADFFFNNISSFEYNNAINFHKLGIIYLICNSILNENILSIFFKLLKIAYGFINTLVNNYELKRQYKYYFKDIDILNKFDNEINLQCYKNQDNVEDVRILYLRLQGLFDNEICII